MADEASLETAKGETGGPTGPVRSRDEVALELMKFIAVTTGYGRGASAAGFSAKTPARSPEEHAEALLQLYDKCRAMLAK